VELGPEFPRACRVIGIEEATVVGIVSKQSLSTSAYGEKRVVSAGGAGQIKSQEGGRFKEEITIAEIF